MIYLGLSLTLLFAYFVFIAIRTHQLHYTKTIRNRHHSSFSRHRFSSSHHHAPFRKHTSSFRPHHVPTRKHTSSFRPVSVPKPVYPKKPSRSFGDWMRSIWRFIKWTLILVCSFLLIFSAWVFLDYYVLDSESTQQTTSFESSVSRSSNESSSSITTSVSKKEVSTEIESDTDWGGVIGIGVAIFWALVFAWVFLSSKTKSRSRYSSDEIDESDQDSGDSGDSGD